MKPTRIKTQIEDRRSSQNGRTNGKCGKYQRREENYIRKESNRAIEEHKRDFSQGFTDAYFFHPNELRDLFESHEVETLEMATCEGLSSHLQEQTNKIYEDKKKWEHDG